MPPYDLINYNYFILAMSIGLGITILVILARGVKVFSLTLTKRSDKEIEEDVHEFGTGVTERNSPVPLFIWLIIGCYFCWAIIYVIYSGVAGL